MAITVTHAKIATLPDEPGAEINKLEWNDNHVISGLGTAAESAVGDFDAAGSATAAVAAHVAAGDPHTQYQKESEKDAANGYAGLSASSKLAGTQQTYGSAANTACEGNDARLSDARAPNGAASGDLAGTYPSPTVTQARGIREITGPTTLVVGAVADGEFLRRVGATLVGAVPGAGSVNIKQVELDFGSTPVFEAEFTITDAEVSATSQVLMQVSYEAPTGRDLDEVEMEPFNCRCGNGTGTFPAHIVAIDGPVDGLYKFNYLIG